VYMVRYLLFWELSLEHCECLLKCLHQYLLQWFGEGEKYVKAVFSLASKISPSVVFVDEVCALHPLVALIF